jgi:membrane fusion protein, heavy metal efflux system
LVISVHANTGDYVKKGQVLARYHADEVRDSRAQYRGAKAELERARAGVAQAQRIRDRSQRLLDLRAGSTQQVEASQQDVVTAQTAVNRAQIEVERLRDLLEHELHVPAEPAAGSSESDADEVPIIAPESGYIIARNVTPGKTVELSTDTFVIADISKVWMLASVRQEDLGKLRTGQTAMVMLPGQPDAQVQGKITNLGQQFNPETRVMEVRIELANPAGRLRPEMLASAAIPLGGKSPGVVVASDAVQQVNGQDVLFVKTAPDRFMVRAVRVGETMNGRTPILEGVKAGEQVAVRGTFILKSQLLKSTLESE